MSNARKILSCAVVLIALGMGACSPDEGRNNADGAEVPAANSVSSADAGAPLPAKFVSANATDLGTVSVTNSSSGLILAIAASDMPAGAHGIHLHEKGLCEGPKFTSAGRHWNPASKQHGRENPQGAHLGDLANLVVAANGSATIDVAVSGASSDSIADADGTALVIHAKADDYKTDPSGDSGDRIACAVLAPPR